MSYIIDTFSEEVPRKLFVLASKRGRLKKEIICSPLGGKFFPGPEVITLFSCSTQLSMTFFMLINLKLLTMPNSFSLNIAEHEIFSAYKYESANDKIFSAYKYENANYRWHFHIYKQRNFHAQLS